MQYVPPTPAAIKAWLEEIQFQETVFPRHFVPGDSCKCSGRAVPQPPLRRTVACVLHGQRILWRLVRYPTSQRDQ
jgi:hypothetical protein